MKNSIPLLFVLLIILSGCATKRDFIYLDERLSELERYRIEALKEETEIKSRLDTLDKSQDNVDQGTKTQYADVKSDLNSLKQEIRTLNGRIDELRHLLEDLGGKFESLQKEIQRLDEKTTLHTDRIIRLEEYLGFEQRRGTETRVGTQIVKKEMPADELYNRAKRSFDKNNFDAARLGFNQFLSKYPDSKNSDNALFWIGESYFREKQYKKAILEYQKVIEKYPKGNKVSAALLKQGLAFSHIAEGSNARLILNELIRRFPKSKEADIARTSLKKIK